MNRRDFLKRSALSSLLVSSPSVVLANGDSSFGGKFLMTVYAHGGWDPTVYCDPKVNVEGERVITNWSKTDSVKHVGNIKYAPFANNDAFFKKHYQKMLVVNGIDCQTNSHLFGEFHNMAGAKNTTFPSLSALYAAVNRTNETMAWVSSGFRPKSGKLIAPSFMTSKNDLNRMKELAEPNRYSPTSSSYHMAQEDVQLIRENVRQRTQAQIDEGKQLLRNREQFKRFMEATDENEGFERFFEVLDNADTNGLDANNGNYSQIIAALAGFYSGLSISADLRISNFDTHSNHDQNHAERFTRLNNAVDLAWHVAEQFGLEDRLVVHIVSDIGRTPYYNEKDGKDHWSTTSGIIMENNPSWGNNVVGSTSEGFRAEPINFQTMEKDDNGQIMTAADVMASLRRYLNIDTHPLVTSTFAVDSVQTPNLFG